MVLEDDAFVILSAQHKPEHRYIVRHPLDCPTCSIHKATVLQTVTALTGASFLTSEDATVLIVGTVLIPHISRTGLPGQSAQRCRWPGTARSNCPATPAVSKRVGVGCGVTSRQPLIIRRYLSTVQRPNRYVRWSDSHPFVCICPPGVGSRSPWRLPSWLTQLQPFRDRACPSLRCGAWPRLPVHAQHPVPATSVPAQTCC